MNKIKWVLFAVLVACFLFSCKEEPKDSKASVRKNVHVPTFNEESAYNFVQKQVNFGYRIPGTDAHKLCKEWLINTLKSFGSTVKEQEFNASFFDVNNVKASNIIAQFNPDQSKRILLAAHWDSRSKADKETDEAMKSLPIVGADDGGSGVAVLLEIAKTISENPIDLGVDIVLFDAEDQGDAGDLCQGSCSWCLGSQYWSSHLYPSNYSAEYGVLLDMVGAKNASFYKEGISRAYAGKQLDKIWTLANRMGYSDFFLNKSIGQITDDHRFVNTIAQIPMLDIINLKPEKRDNWFHQCWHTHCDDMEIIDRRTLRVVGQVVTAVLYKESGNTL